MADVRDSRGRSTSVDDERDRGRSRSSSRNSRDANGRGRRSDSPRSRSRSHTRSPGGPRSAKIVVEKLTKNVNEGHLREIFGAYGEIEELEMPLNKQFLTNRGIAYVLYATPEFAENAIAHMHEAQLDGALINVSIVLPRRRFSRSPPPRRPPPNRFGEAHRYRDAAADRGRGGGRGGRRSPPRRGGYGDRGYGRDYSRSRSPPRRRSPDYGDRSRSRSPRRRSPPRGGGGRRRSPSYDSYSDDSRGARRGDRRR